MNSCKLHEFTLVAPFRKTPPATHLQDSQFKKSEPKFTTVDGIPCVTHMKFGEVPMKGAGDSRQDVEILAILRLPRSCRSASFPATTAPMSNSKYVISGRCFRFAIACAISMLYGSIVPQSAKNPDKIRSFSPLKMHRRYR